MVKVVEPKVTVIDYGPTLTLENGQTITPDEFVWGASQIAFRDTGTINELIELKQNEENIEEKVRTSLISSAGAGHASMATTPGFWIYLEGNCSKLVDSIFTPVRFGSSLMPSGRRVPVSNDQIVVPKGIIEKGPEAMEIYLRASDWNIRLYDLFQERGVPKEEAAKIIQYGHHGGGFMFVPLETMIGLSFDFKKNETSTPREALEIVKNLEDFVHSHGMGVVYEARKNAPRSPCPNPNIFTEQKNLAQEQVEASTESPRILTSYAIPSKERERRVNEYTGKLQKIYGSRETTEANWKDILREAEGIVRDFNDSVRVVTFANSPWRVWGEVKRHRTLSQTVESIYNACERANKSVAEIAYFPATMSQIDKANTLANVLSIPEAIKKDSENLRMWIDAFSQSINAYQNLISSGVSKSDAVCVVPRGIKVGIIKSYGWDNLTTEMMSLRLCNDVEPEMRATTRAEYKLIQDSNLSQDVKDMMKVKCHYTGFCHNRKHCGNIMKVSPWYNPDVHKELQANRAKEITEAINSHK